MAKSTLGRQPTEPTSKASAKMPATTPKVALQRIRDLETQVQTLRGVVLLALAATHPEGSLTTRTREASRTLDSLLNLRNTVDAVHATADHAEELAETNAARLEQLCGAIAAQGT